MEKHYLIVDLGTGNSRVALVSSDGKIRDMIAFENRYCVDEAYEDALYFVPLEWETKLLDAAGTIAKRNPEVPISAITSSGARQTVVCYDKNGTAFCGLPNIDNRGRRWMDEIPDKAYIYERTGRWVTEDFPAAKLMGYDRIYGPSGRKIAKITSFSEWIGAIFTGKIVMEPSQACETQLFDIETLAWSKTICGYYGIDPEILPEIRLAGESLGRIKADVAEMLHIPPEAEFIVGGGDTQIAVKGIGIQTGDVGIVSGTTSPVVTVTGSKFYDERERCWTDCNLGGKTWQVETNPGVTGNNYQRMKKNFFADMSYEELDAMLAEKTEFLCTASLTSLHFSEKRSLKKGGFVMRAPLSASLAPDDLLWALVGDIACAIFVQYKSLTAMLPHKKEYILGCGGGFQSKVLCQMIADLTEKELILYEGFEQAAVNGCVKICNEYFGLPDAAGSGKKLRFAPRGDSLIKRYYPVWAVDREMLNREVFRNLDV